MGNVGSMARAVGINHLALEVGSIDEALDFLDRVVGPLRLRGRSRRMAFVDMGDQFLALSAVRSQAPDEHRHFGLVVDDRDAVMQAAREAGAEVIGRNDFRDPWGNVFQVVDYRDVQFTKTPEILRGMELQGLEKSERALAELRAKGLA
jgi:predicted enzyme related to lactoylglutathione lyase